MSDSGRQINDCKHGNNRHTCIKCKYENNARQGMTVTLSDTKDEIAELKAEVERLRASADYWQRMAEEALDELKKITGGE